MIVLLGETRYGPMVEAMKHLGWGRIWTVSKPTPWPGEPWAFDSGVYADWSAGREFDIDRFFRRVEKAHKVGVPYMAVAPDIVGGGMKSLEFSLLSLESLPEDYPWFLAVQNDMDKEMVEPIIHKFSGLFLGGTNRFKSTADRWVELAHSQGLPFHYGRVGTPRKLETARAVGADSCDSSFPLFTMDRFLEFADHWLNGSRQYRFDFDHRRRDG